MPVFGIDHAHLKSLGYSRQIALMRPNREADMAKGQQRSNREKKKPKADKNKKKEAPAASPFTNLMGKGAGGRKPS